MTWTRITVGQFEELKRLVVGPTSPSEHQRSQDALVRRDLARFTDNGCEITEAGREVARKLGIA